MLDGVLRRLVSGKKERRGEESTPSFMQNLGRTSFTYRDSDIYGRFLNTCRLAAWQYALAKFDVDRKEILDIGCSYGSWAENYRSLGFGKLIGIDPNPEVIEKAKSLPQEDKSEWVSVENDYWFKKFNHRYPDEVREILDNEPLPKAAKED